MSYFESILQKRGLEECPLPLWKLKITEEEFKELRDLLEKRTHVINMGNPFKTLRKECTLFFAEYWRRLYVDGKHSKQMVYDAVESTRLSVNLSDEFYEAARRGAKLLKIFNISQKIPIFLLHTHYIYRKKDLLRCLRCKQRSYFLLIR